MGIDRGFGIEGAPQSYQELEELNKALSATYGYDGASTSLSGGGVLQVESLDATMKVVTFEEQHLKLWPMIPKSRAFNTVEEINRMRSYGEMPEGMGFFDAEAQVTPGERDPVFSREVLKIRYVGDTRIVTHPATLVRTSGESMMAIQARAGTVSVLSMMERGLFRAKGFHLAPATGVQTGDPANCSTSNLQFVGLEAQIRYGDTDSNAQYAGFDGYDGNTSVVYDLLGAIPGPDDLEECGRRSAEGWGIPTHMLLSYKMHSDISRQWLEKERVNPLGVSNGVSGFVLQDFFSSGGIFKLVGSKFLNSKRTPKAVADTNAPGVPVLTSVTFEADTSSRLVDGTWSYRISALNNSGESTASAQTAAAMGGAGKRAIITIAAGCVGALYYALYRAPVGTTVGHEFVGFVKDAGIAAGVAARDAGARDAGLQTAFLLSVSEREMTCRQLAPLLKMDLAVVSPALRFMVLLYASPWIFCPRHMVLLDNCGRS